ncbi:hypothetical protein EDD22DRAFT_935595 [Suillus occidentalis]|nr:hypothetical protein EDD22DRAFT_935595 [Suillus occidentalis]
MFNGKFADAKLSCHLVPTRHKDFRFSSDDFPAIYDNFAIHTAAGINSIKLVHHLFTVKPTEESQDQYTINPQGDDTSSDTATNLGSEFEISNWPVADRCKGHLADLAQTHIVNPLPAYDTDHQLIPPTQYESKLCGTVVEVHFAFFHHHIQRSKRHIFNAVLRELIVLRPPSNMPSSLLKRCNIGTGPASDKPSKGKKRVHTSGKSNFTFCASLTFIPTFPQKPSKGHVL